MKKQVLYSATLSVICMLMLAAPAGLQAQVTFTDANNLLTTNNYQSGAAIAIADMNGDGKDDIVHLDNAREVNIEYQQAPGQPFTHYTFGNLAGGSAWGMCIADVDHNGFNDILAGGAYNDIKLLKANSTGTAYTSSSIPNSNIFLQGVNFADLDNDGWLDIFACHDDADSPTYRNLGNGSFVLDESLMDTALPSGNSGNYGSVFTDYDNDGDLDMYLSKCRGGVSDPNDPRRINRLFMNDGSNSFADVGGTAGLRLGEQSWATDFGDIDNDGDMDCFVINHGDDSLLFRNNGDGTFTDITTGSGIEAGLNGENGIQTVFRDFDNDGFVDLLFAGSEHRLFFNDGDSTFTWASNPFGTADIQSFAVGDLNSDGFVDIFAGHANGFNSPSGTDDDVFINNGNSNNSCSVRLQGVGANLNGVGARLELHGSWGMQIREVRSGESYGIMNGLNCYFGIGAATSVDKLVVRWPNGTVDEVLNPAINVLSTISEGSFPPGVQYNPDSYELMVGTVFSGSLADVDASDDSYFELKPQIAKGESNETISIVFETQLATDSPSELKMTVESRATSRIGGIGVVRTPLDLTTEVYNWTTSQFDVVNVRNAGYASDKIYELDLTADIGDYVQPGTGQLDIRLNWDPRIPNGKRYKVVIDEFRVDTVE